MKPTIKIRFTEPQIAFVMRAYPNCNLDRLTELSFEFDQAGQIIDCIGTIKAARISITIILVAGLRLVRDGAPAIHSSTNQRNDIAISKRSWRYSAYMRPRAIVWDLETVPDLAGFAAANDLVGKSDIEVREATGEAACI